MIGLKLTDLTFAQFAGLVAALFAMFVAIVGAYNAISTALKNRREQKQIANSPLTKLQDDVSKINDKLEKDKSRLDEHEKQLMSMGQENKIMLRGVRALLSHEINGNSDDKLRASLSEIDDYLIARK